MCIANQKGHKTSQHTNPGDPEDPFHAPTLGLGSPRLNNRSDESDHDSTLLPIRAHSLRPDLAPDPKRKRSSSTGLPFVTVPGLPNCSKEVIELARKKKRGDVPEVPERT